MWKRHSRTAKPVAGRAGVSVARQPILDRNGELLGYELLFREPGSGTAGVLDDRAATSTVILDGLFDVGLSDLVGDHPAYVNVSRDFLLSVRPPPLPPWGVVLELLEDQLVDDELLGVLEGLVGEGFTIALDDFRLTPETEQLIRFARIVKIDNRVISRDAGLSIRLLRYANSAYVSLPRRVGSVQEGLAWLGAATVRRFALMVALASAQDVPDELLVNALVRARMCQLLSGAGEGAAADSYFTVGLFSVADAIADAPMELVIAQLPFRHDVVDPLLYGGGRLGELLGAVIAYQRGDFDAARGLIAGHADVEQIYREAITWADNSMAALA